MGEHGAQHPAANLPWASVYPGRQDAVGSSFTPHLEVRKVVRGRSGSDGVKYESICRDGQHVLSAAKGCRRGGATNAFLGNRDNVGFCFARANPRCSACTSHFQGGDAPGAASCSRVCYERRGGGHTDARHGLLFFTRADEHERGSHRYAQRYRDHEPDLRPDLCGPFEPREEKLEP